MNKESSHRSHELKAIGWNLEDITRYEELWEYSQRWGLINLEREDRQFLKKAEKLIPKLQPKKTSTKKTIKEKVVQLICCLLGRDEKQYVVVKSSAS